MDTSVALYVIAITTLFCTGHWIGATVLLGFLLLGLLT